MVNIKYLIIGGGVAGTTAAETIRKEDKTATIAIVSDEPHPFYSRVMLSKPAFFLGKIPFGKIWLRKELWYKKNNITLIRGRRAIDLDYKKKIILLQDSAEIRYEKLLLAIGGHSRKLNIPGGDKKGVLYLRTLNDAKKLIAAIKNAKKTAVIGGGFIGFEACEALRLAGAETTLIIRENYFWGNILDETGSSIIENALKDRDVKIIRNTETGEIMGNKKVNGVLLKNGQKVISDIVVVSIGIYCPCEWLKMAGIEVNRGILANEYLETNAPDIWTAGDAAEFTNILTHEKELIGNWTNAQRQGETAAFNMLGKHKPFKHVPFCNTAGFGLNIAFIGDFEPEKGKEIISRGSKKTGSYGRIIIKNNKIIGAILINMMDQVSAMVNIIENGSEYFKEQTIISNEVLQ